MAGDLAIICGSDLSSRDEASEGENLKLKKQLNAAKAL